MPQALAIDLECSWRVRGTIPLALIAPHTLVVTVLMAFHARSLLPG
jgi:hypothetical protein